MNKENASSKKLHKAKILNHLARTLFILNSSKGHCVIICILSLKMVEEMFFKGGNWGEMAKKNML